MMLIMLQQVLREVFSRFGPIASTESRPGSRNDGSMVRSVYVCLCLSMSASLSLCPSVFFSVPNSNETLVTVLAYHILVYLPVCLYVCDSDGSQGLRTPLHG